MQNGGTDVAPRGDGPSLKTGLKPPFCKKRPLLVGFERQTGSQKTREQQQLPRLLRPRLSLKTH